jgi:hypothetical protein
MQAAMLYVGVLVLVLGTLLLGVLIKSIHG